MKAAEERLVITGWGVLSPIGIDRERFTEGLSRGEAGLKRLEASASEVLPFQEAYHIPEFDTAGFLGPKGTRSMDRTTGMAVATVAMALKHSGLDGEAAAGRVGVVLGTSTGSIKSIVDFTKETWVQERPYLVNPAHFPNTVMNCATGQCAIWHRLSGVNATISGGHASAVLALKYAGLAIRRGYADGLLVGAVEEFCEPAAWAHFRLASEDRTATRGPGEGCAVFVVERESVAQSMGRGAVAEILACEVAFCPDADDEPTSQAEALAACIRRGLDRVGVALAQVAVCAPCARRDTVLNAVEETALGIVQGTEPGPELLPISELVGDCFSASGALQLAGVLAWAEGVPERVPCYGLVTSITRDGTVGCVVVRCLGERS